MPARAKWGIKLTLKARNDFCHKARSLRTTCSMARTEGVSFFHESIMARVGTGSDSGSGTSGNFSAN